MTAVRLGSLLSAAREPAPTHFGSTDVIAPSSGLRSGHQATSEAGLMPDTPPPIRSLTAKSNLDVLRREARRWQKAIVAGDADAIARLQRAMPGHAGAATLREAQQALAREHGFANWAALRQDLED